MPSPTRIDNIPGLLSGDIYVDTGCLWRWLKGNILANRQPQPFSETVRLALSTLEALGSSDVLRISGILSGHFWLPT